MRTCLIRDLNDCNQFRQTIETKPPRLMHGAVLILASLLVGALLWAAFTRVNLVVRALGRVRPVTTPIKVYAARGDMLGGKVTEVFFVQGQEVRQGDVLLRFDTERLRNEIARKRRTIAAGEEELEKGERLAELQQQQTAAAVAKLEAEIAQAREEIKNSKQRQQAELKLAQAEEGDAEREEQSLRRLESLNAIAPSEVLKAEAKRRELNQKVQRLKVPVEEGKVQVLLKALTLAEQDTSIRAQEVQIKRSLKQAEIEAARIEVANLELDVEQAQLRAPLTGVVTSAEVKVGDVIEPGRAVVEIAEQRGFRFELFVSSEEIAKVKVGMPVKIKLEAYDFQKYGTLDGKIDFISPDSAVVEGRPGAVYLVMVTLDGEKIGRGDLVGQVKLGMAGQAEVVTGEESLLKLLFKKIRQSVSLQ